MRPYARLPWTIRAKRQAMAAMDYMAENWKLLLGMAAFALVSSVNIP